MRRVLISIVLLLTLTVFAVFSESCVDNVSGRNGKCTIRKNCKEIFSKVQNTRPQICDPVKRTICCPEKLVQTPTVKPYRISDKKCGEYSTNMFSHGNTKKTPICHKVNKLIDDRVPAAEKEFPHMALIGYKGGNFDDYKCSGSLISEQWVLSVAHCSYSSSLGEAKHIKLGALKRLELEPSTKIFSIIENVQHPSYTVLNVEHDIALFKMNQPVTLNLHISPICLQQSEYLPTESAFGTGWGKTQYANAMSPVLMKMSFDYFPISSCQNSFKHQDELEGTDFSNTICAGYNRTKNVCQGHSGSPLQYSNRDHYCMYTVSGIASHGSVYCRRNSRGTIYTKVYKYLDWIEGIVWPEE